MADVEKMTGSEFRGWKLGEILGKGGSAIVYAGTRDDKHAAVKIFFAEALEKHGFEEEQQRLELQLQLRGHKQHPNLVEIYDGGVAEEIGNTLFLIMEKVPGNTIDKVLQDIPRTSIGPLVKQLAEAARFLEQRELAHRDIKPENVMVSEDFSHLTLLDLGVVRFLNSENSDRLSGQRFVGTPRYSPPEFVWRTEGNSVEACRAITIYQIGGTLHDLIMKKIEKDDTLGFGEKLEVQLQLALGDGATESIEITISARSSGAADPLYEAKWIESPVLEKVLYITQQALLQIADRQVPQA